MNANMELCVEDSEGVAGLEGVNKVVERVAPAGHSALIDSSVILKLPPSPAYCWEFVDVDDWKHRWLMVRRASMDEGVGNGIFTEIWEFVTCGDANVD